MAWRAIKGHKLRSTLTTLGIVIGIAAVITFVTLGASLSAAIVGDVGAGEAQTMNVWAGPEDTQGGGGPGFGAQPVFTEHDLDRLRNVEGVESVIPYGQVATTAVGHDGDRVATSGVVATTPAYFDDAEFREGGSFEPGTRQVVLNPAAAEQFEQNATVGSTVTITLANGSTVDAEVAGVLDSSEGQSAFEGFGGSPRIYVSTDPFYSTQVESPSQSETQRVYSLLLVRASDPETVEATQDRVRGYLEDESDAADLAPEDYQFEVQTSEELLEQLQDVLDRLTAFVTGIAVLSLIVGAIGIANIMLVSVTERTREIGIMKAVGAKKRDVLTLFLVEASVIGIIGAVIGTLLGIVGGWAVTTLLDFPLTFPVEWFPIAVVVGVAVGVLSGLYPAWSGARTDPIEALRYE
ncbi:ABC transporter permease [Halobacteriales archaeon QS_1_68_20]|nr:MAG: ABC transporter permease [Halobacteriales archaeon QS_1_68_20]